MFFFFFSQGNTSDICDWEGVGCEGVDVIEVELVFIFHFLSFFVFF